MCACHPPAIPISLKSLIALERLEASAHDESLQRSGASKGMQQITTETWRRETQQWLAIAGLAASHQTCTWEQTVLARYPAQCSVARYLLGHQGRALCFRGNCEPGSAPFLPTHQSHKAEACFCPAQEPDH